MSCAVVELLLPADPAPPLERKDPMQLPRAVHRPGSLLGSRAFYFSDSCFRMIPEPLD